MGRTLTWILRATSMAAFAGLLSGGCAGGIGGGTSCTEIGCQNGLRIEFSRPLRESGAYTLSLTLDGADVTCQAALPFASCETNSGCTSNEVLLELSGCALPATDHEFLGLQIASTPKTARIAVERDGAQIASAEFTPTYQRTQPNGDGCPPICDQASATLAVP